MKPSPVEVAAEIAALKALKPTGISAHKIAAQVEIMIGALEGTVDETAAEFEELGEDLQDCYNQARGWKDGQVHQRPGEGWTGLAE